MKAALILATQQFDRHPAYEDPDVEEFLFIESAPRFAQVPYHRHKIVLLLSAMRHTVERLRREGRTVRVVDLAENVSFAAALGRLLRRHGVTALTWMSATDRGVDDRIRRLCERHGVRAEVTSDQLFLTSADEADGWFAAHPRPLMEDFYRWQRRRTGVLMDGERPVGGRWNFDADNRHPLPRRGLSLPDAPSAAPDEITRAVISEVDERFATHPGLAEQFWLPVEPVQARSWLDAFVAERLPSFGRYEDAMAADGVVLFHSVLSPLLNTGLLTVADVMEAVQGAADVPLPSLEGFVRQVIGWREYMRGAYRAYPHLTEVNALELSRPLEAWWYTGRDIPEGVPSPVRTVLERVHRWGYAHHIERLMVLGNWFLLQGYAPREVYLWFLALFVDAYEWVMVPNVMGMSQYADGGLIATKPYISGSAYLQRMGSWWETDAAARRSPFTEAYWGFLERHEARLTGNPRLAMPLAQMRTRRDSRLF